MKTVYSAVRTGALNRADCACSVSRAKQAITFMFYTNQQIKCSLFSNTLPPKCTQHATRTRSTMDCTIFLVCAYTYVYCHAVSSKMTFNEIFYVFTHFISVKLMHCKLILPHIITDCVCLSISKLDVSAKWYIGLSKDYRYNKVWIYIFFNLF